MKKSIFIAFIIVVAATLWILSGVLNVDNPKNEAPETTSEASNAVKQPPIPQVRVKALSAQTMNDETEVTGRTQASRQVIIRAETEGSIASLNVKKGQKIQTGAVIAKLRVKDRGAQLEQARQLLKQRQIQYNASKELAEKGYNSRVRLAEKEAELGSARAQVKQAQEELSNIIIKAPFGGFINQQMVEIGDYVNRGSDIIEVVDLNPIEITGFLTEKQISNVKQGQPIAAKLLNGEVVEGNITFIAAAANKDTRTFEMEMTVPNNQGIIKEGLTAKILVPFKEDKAYKISPSILSLTDDGRIGVKIVTSDNKVEFKPVQLLKDTPDYLWIKGLPDQVKLITVGQEFVNEGQTVDPILSTQEDSLL